MCRASISLYRSRITVFVPKILNERIHKSILMSDFRDNKSQDNYETGALAHVVGLLAGFIGTIAFYYVVEDNFVKKNAAEATNWQLSVIIYAIIPSVVTGFSGFAFIFLFLNFCFSGIAAKKCLDGESWEYPLSLSVFSVDDDESESYRIKDNDNVERIKKLYRTGVIDEEEMENRIERTLKYNESRKPSSRLTEDRDRQYEYN